MTEQRPCPHCGKLVKDMVWHLEKRHGAKPGPKTGASIVEELEKQKAAVKHFAPQQRRIPAVYKVTFTADVNAASVDLARTEAKRLLKELRKVSPDLKFDLVAIVEQYIK